MLTVIRLAIWAFPLVGLLKARERPSRSQPFTPEGVAEELRRISDSVNDHAATLSPEAAAPLRAIARNIQESSGDVVAWGATAAPGRTSRLRRLLGFR